jgi:hypothetical protein
MNTELLKELRIIDSRYFFCRVRKSYTELGKNLRIATGLNATSGVDSILGIFEDKLVCFEMALFNSNPSREVFRIPIKDIISVELEKGFFGWSYVMFVSTDKRKYKLVASLRKKVLLDAIYAVIKK